MSSDAGETRVPRHPLIVPGSSIVRQVWCEVARGTIDQLVRPFGYSYEKLLEMGTGVAVVGSRAALCNRPDSDWDVFVQLRPGEPSFTRKRTGIDLMFEDPTHEAWLRRELPNHMAAYSIWLDGEQQWKNEDLDWERCEAFVARRVEKSLLALSRVVHSAVAVKYAIRAVGDARRLQHLRWREYVPPTALLTKRFDGSLLKPRLDVLKDLGALSDDLELI